MGEGRGKGWRQGGRDRVGGAGTWASWRSWALSICLGVGVGRERWDGGGAERRRDGQLGFARQGLGERMCSGWGGQGQCTATRVYVSCLHICRTHFAPQPTRRFQQCVRTRLCPPPLPTRTDGRLTCLSAPETPSRMWLIMLCAACCRVVPWLAAPQGAPCPTAAPPWAGAWPCIGRRT